MKTKILYRKLRHRMLLFCVKKRLFVSWKTIRNKKVNILKAYYKFNSLYDFTSYFPMCIKINHEVTAMWAECSSHL